MENCRAHSATHYLMPPCRCDPQRAIWVRRMRCRPLPRTTRSANPSRGAQKKAGNRKTKCQLDLPQVSEVSFERDDGACVVVPYLGTHLGTAVIAGSSPLPRLDAGLVYDEFPLMGRRLPRGYHARRGIWRNLFENTTTVDSQVSC